MALIKCPECGKDVSDKATACIHCGYPLTDIGNRKGKLIIKAQTQPIDCTVKQLTFDICTITGKKLCVVEPGRVVNIEINDDLEIMAIPTYGPDYAKEKRKTNSLKISNHKTTRVQLAFVRVMLGMAIKAVLNEVDVVDTE